MFFYLKKGFSVIISLLYIFVNYNFYNSIFHEYSNDKIFHITTELAVIEIIFWITLFSSIFQLENKEISKNKKIKTKDMEEKEIKKDKIELIICYAIFLISLICVNISRIILQSSPYMNDVVSTVSSYLLFFGGTRVIFIFSSIIIISIMIWLDIDTNITSIMRVIISIFAIIYYLYLIEDNKKINKIRRVNK